VNAVPIRRAQHVGGLLRSVIFGHDKGASEFRYWVSRKVREGDLSNAHYEQFFTTCFGLDCDFYAGKKILDIGCGPRGSLEWADMAVERVGLDPIVESYRALGIDKHKMTYVGAPAERIPYPDGYFDVVSSFNSLDHVDDLKLTVAEIGRVVAPNGLFLLITDLNHDPTPAEPQTFSWEIVDGFPPSLVVVVERHYEKSRHGVYESILTALPYDLKNPVRRNGILVAQFAKRADRSTVDSQDGQLPASLK
jgi:ubiquinone/menaquinone biosynthesis C-methylase UbiE